MNTAGRFAWWNIGLWPVCPVEMFSATFAISGLQTRWAHRLKVYVPLTPACHGKGHPMFTPHQKSRPTVLANLNMT